jgi:hypothetical protein
MGRGEITVAHIIQAPASWRRRVSRRWRGDKIAMKRTLAVAAAGMIGTEMIIAKGSMSCGDIF